MGNTITKEELYDLLFGKLNSMSGLTDLYIGKTDNIEKRRKEHLEKDGLQYTEEIAHGDKKAINDGEIYLIKKFKKSKLPFKNIDNGGSGNPDANILYVSYNYDTSTISTIDDLDDDDLSFDFQFQLI